MGPAHSRSVSPQAYEPPEPPAYRSGSGPLRPNGGALPPPPLPGPPYGGPTPASYATASTPAGPAFPVQVKVAQPVRGCGPPRRGASQASGPSLGPHFPLPGRGEVWGAGYRSHREPGPGAKEEAAGVSGPAGGRGGGYGSQVSPGCWDFGSIKDKWMLTWWGTWGVVNVRGLGCWGSGFPVDVGKFKTKRRVLDLHPGCQRGSPSLWAGTCSLISFRGRTAWSPWGPSVTALGARGRAKPLILTSQVPPSQPPEEELERLTKKLVHDMNHPPSGEYFGELTPRPPGGGTAESEGHGSPGQASRPVRGLTLSLPAPRPVRWLRRRRGRGRGRGRGPGSRLPRGLLCVCRVPGPAAGPAFLRCGQEGVL